MQNSFYVAKLVNWNKTTYKVDLWIFRMNLQPNLADFNQNCSPMQMLYLQTTHL